MAFQVVELTLDADDNVIDRRAIPYPYPTRAEAVDTIESVLSRHAESGYETDGDFWWALLETVKPGLDSSLKVSKPARSPGRMPYTAGLLSAGELPMM